MASNLAIQLWMEPLRSLSYASISGTYMGIGSPTTYPTRVYWIQNNTDVLLTFSWDGINDMFVLPDDGFFLLDGTANQSAVGGMFAIPTGTRTYVKGSPTLGSVDLTVVYGRNG
jgi:hypothetical protein